MKIFRNILLPVAVAGMVASPALAQTELARPVAPVDGESELGGPSIILAILAVAAIIAGIVIATGGGDDDAVSP